MVKSCYIHIPFCNRICSYCDFPKMLYNEKFVYDYLESLEQEITSKYHNEELDTLYIGGGTPSSLNIDELEYLFQIISKLNLSDNCEITIECNFDSITHDKLDLFKKNGVNRISFGLESTNKNNLKLLNRNLDLDYVKDIINYCNNIGLNNINVDLMYAIENESIKDLENDIDFILGLNIKHISTYSLIIEEHTKLFIDNVKYISEDIDSDMYNFICNKLESNGFIHYEISNFARKGYESKHNLTYWNNLEYYGFGLGAAGYIDNVRYTNTRSLSAYNKGNYVLEEEHLSIDDKIEYEIILNLRKNDGIDLNKFKQTYGKELNCFYKYDSLLEEKLLIEENKRLFIPKKLWYISNAIIVKLLEGVIQ